MHSTVNWTDPFKNFADSATILTLLTEWNRRNVSCVFFFFIIQVMVGVRMGQLAAEKHLGNMVNELFFYSQKTRRNNENVERSPNHTNSSSHSFCSQVVMVLAWEQIPQLLNMVGTSCFSHSKKYFHFCKKPCDHFLLLLPSTRLWRTQHSAQRKCSRQIWWVKLRIWNLEISSLLWHCASCAAGYGRMPYEPQTAGLSPEAKSTGQYSMKTFQAF